MLSPCLSCVVTVWPAGESRLRVCYSLYSHLNNLPKIKSESWSHLFRGFNVRTITNWSRSWFNFPWPTLLFKMNFWLCGLLTVFMFILRFWLSSLRLPSQVSDCTFRAQCKDNFIISFHWGVSHSGWRVRPGGDGVWIGHLWRSTAGSGQGKQLWGFRMLFAVALSWLGSALGWILFSGRVF